MSGLLFDPPEVQSIAVAGETAAFPVHRIFCVARNYAAHAAEMGAEVDREAPFYFTKSAEAVIASGASVPYPPGTANYHYEMELVLAIGRPAFRIPVGEASTAVYGYGCGLDMTRRDIQLAAREKGRPWDLAKNFEQSAVLSPLVKAETVEVIGPQRIHLAVNGKTRQDARLSDLIWSVEEIVSDLSHFYHLKPGDLIMTGTPAGVDAVVAGDRITGGIDGLGTIELTIGAAE